MGRADAGVRAASETSIEIDFRYRGERCKEKLKLPPTPPNLAYARKFRARVLHEIAVGTFDYAVHFPDSPRALRLAKRPELAITLAEAMGLWLRHAKAELQPETWGDYDEYRRTVWEPTLGKKRLGDVTISIVRDWISDQKASRKRILNVLTPLRQTMRYCVEERLLPSDPLAGLRVRRPDAVTEDRIDPFTPAEVEAIASALPPPVANMARAWAWTGLRQGELFALSWPDVDLEAGTVRVTKALRDGRTKAPKTRKGVREFRLLAPALEAIRAQREHTQLRRAQVFLDPETGAAWRSDKAFRKAWTAAVAKAGVRYRFPRQLRHTFASWMLSSGENPLWVARVMGHEDASLTLRVYSRFIPDVFPDAGSRAIAAISGGTKR